MRTLIILFSISLLPFSSSAAEKMGDGLYAQLNTSKGKITIRLEYEKTHREYFAREMGAQMSATVSGVITCIASVLIFVVMMFF